MRTGFFAGCDAARAGRGIIASNHGRPKPTPTPRSRVLREIVLREIPVMSVLTFCFPLPGGLWACWRWAPDFETARLTRLTQPASGHDNHCLSTQRQCGRPYRNLGG